MKIFLVLTVLAFESAFFRSTSANLGRVIGGESAARGEAPYIVAFVHNNSIFCAGSIIHPNWVLTAAHCIYDEPFDIIAGAYYIQPKIDLWGTQVRRIFNVSYVVMHDASHEDNFDSWDVALVYLEEPFDVTESERVQIIHIPEHEFEKFPREEAYFFGWGYIRGGVLPQNLRFLTVTIISFYECQALLKHDIPLMDYHVCTEGPDGLCLHDGGGPLMREYDGIRELIGVASWGESPCDSRISPSVFVRVDKSLGWIKHTMATFKPPGGEK